MRRAAQEAAGGAAGDALSGLCKQAMWQCSSSVTSKHLWERGERETAHGPAATAGAQLRATPPRLGVTTARAAPSMAIDATSSASCSGPPNSSVAAVCGRCSRH